MYNQNTLIVFLEKDAKSLGDIHFSSLYLVLKYCNVKSVHLILCDMIKREKGKKQIYYIYYLCLLYIFIYIY